MTNRAFFRISLIAGMLFALSCTPAVPPLPSDIGEVPLQDKYTGYFTIGAAVGPLQLSSVRNILDFHFNRLTCENAMKFERIHPSENTYYFTNADAVANYARSRGIKMTGHTLVWHSQTPTWLFSDLSPGDSGSITELKLRMKDHIDTLVARYYDVVDNWDVVNEAISDGTNTYRDGTEGSNWYYIFSSEEYIYWAFKYTKDALEAQEIGGSAGKLYYNDYGVEDSTKRDKIIYMLRWLKGEVGSLPVGQSPIAIDGVGTQAHWSLDWPSAETIQATIDALTAANLKVKVSELDITIYSGLEEEKTFTEAIAQQQATRYRDIFQVFRDNAAKITSVTLWGVSDDKTWLDDFPVPGRNDYPLLFDDNHAAKPAYDAIIDF